MFADGLLDSSLPSLRLLTVAVVVVVAVEAVVVRVVAVVVKALTEPSPAASDAVDADPAWTCPHCAKRNVGPSRFCDSCKCYASTLDDPGSTQIMLFVGWLPAVVVAAIGGIVVALVTWDLWPLFVVLVGGSVLGWFATMVVFFRALEANSRREFDPGRADTVFLASFFGVGPAVAIAIASVVALTWS